MSEPTEDIPTYLAMPRSYLHVKDKKKSVKDGYKVRGEGRSVVETTDGSVLLKVAPWGPAELLAFMSDNGLAVADVEMLDADEAKNLKKKASDVL